jgi:hypothetical protein
MASSHNDINVLWRSLVFDRLTEVNAPLVHYNINGHPYNKCYYLVDDIYPEWSTFVKTIREPMEEKNRRFSKRQGHAGRMRSMLGIEAENKIFLATRNPNAQDLSINNVVTINWDSVTYPCRPNGGIMLPHKH